MSYALHAQGVVRVNPSRRLSKRGGRDNASGAAFFDLDGTLLRGLMIQAFPRYLAGRRKMSEEFPNKIDAIVAAYVKGTKSYVEVAKKVPRLYAAGIKGLKIEAVEIMAEEFMGTYFQKKAFGYTKRLVRDARKLVDLTIAISGSPQEVVDEVGRFLPFDEIHGSLFTAKSGVYTGMVKRNLILGKPKGDLIDELSRRLMIDLTKSMAFGDTDQDGPVLRRVRYPMAMNPNPSLLKLCIRNKWPWYTEENPPCLKSGIHGNVKYRWREGVTTSRSCCK